MVEPVSLTVIVSSIVGFIFTTASDTVMKNLKEVTRQKINTLTQKVFERLKLKPKAKAELEKKEDKNLEIIKSYLQTEMIEDEIFAEEIKSLVEEINQDLEKEGQGVKIQNVYDNAQGIQADKIEGGIHKYEAQTINIGEKKTP
jgi:hypothetical protein